MQITGLQKKGELRSNTSSVEEKHACHNDLHFFSPPCKTNLDIIIPI